MIKYIVVLCLLNIYKNCSLGCLKCEQQSCKICDSQKGFYLHKDVCFQNDLNNCLLSFYKNMCSICENNYFLRLNKACKQIQDKNIQNCIDYYDNDNCRQCETGYYLENGLCKQIKVVIDNCYVYKDSSSCSFCQKSYFLKNNTCVKFQEVPNCLAYSNPFNCVQCLDRYYLNENYYLNLIENFYTDIMTKKIEIQQYKSDQMMNMPQCERIQEIQFCEKHRNARQCEQCQKGYYLQTPKNCVKNPESFYTLNDYLVEHCYVFDNISNCQFCYNSFYLKENKCHKHDILQENCFLYSAYINSSCLICNQQYYRTLENQLYVCKKRLNLISFCEELAVDDDQCAKCYDGFIQHFDMKKCSKSIINCKEHDINLAVLSCKICERGFKLQNGSCLNESDHCLLQNENGTCQICDLGYILDNSNQCVEMVSKYKFSMCQKQSNNTCENCFYNDRKYKLKAICVQGVDNCYQYDQSGSCQHCQKGYKFQSGECIKNQDLNCDFYDSSQQKCAKCKDSYILSEDSQTCFKIHITNNKHNNSWCIDSDLDYKCNVCFPGYAPFKNLDYEYQQYINFQDNSQNNNLGQNCLIYSSELNKCIFCTNGNILSSDQTQCTQNCQAGESINIFNNKCQTHNNSQCELTDGNICLKCDQNKGLIDLNGNQYLTQISYQQIDENNTNFITKILNIQKECYSTGDFDFKFIDKNYREIEYHWGKTAVVQEQRTGQNYHQITYQDIDCDESVKYSFPEKFENYEKTLTCHKCNNDKYLIVNYSNGKRIADVPFENQIFLNGQNTIDNIQVDCLATNYSSIQNCGIQQNFYQIEGINQENHKCIMCKPGYKPVYDEDEFITDCQLIQNCTSSNTFSQCDSCDSNHNFLYDDYYQIPDKTVCTSTNDSNCIVWSVMYNHCYHCKMNYYYDLNQGRCVQVQQYNDCLSNLDSKNCYINKKQQNNLYTTIIGLSEELSCQPINFYSQDLASKNCLLLNKNLECTQCPINYFLYKGKCLGNYHIPSCQIFEIIGDDIKCQRCKIGYLLNQSKTVCTKNFNGNANDIPNCLRLDDTGSCGLCEENYILAIKYNQQTQKNVKFCVSQIKPLGCLEIQKDIARDSQEIFCKVCQDGYKFETLDISKQQQFCQSPSNIKNCLIMNQNVCDICKVGYYQKYGICYQREVVVPLCQEYDPYTDSCLRVLENISLWERTIDYLSEYNIKVFDDNELNMIKKLPESRLDFGPGIANCEVYSSQSSCKYCKSGFFVDNNNCKIVENSVENCKYYKTDSICEICRNNYLLLSNKCVQIEVQNCDEYLSSSQCQSCLESHPILQNGQCSKPPDFSEKCIKFKQVDQIWTCQQCISMFYPEGKDCKPISKEIENCEIYDSNSSCLQCAVHYYRKNNQCVQVQNMDPNCIEKEYNISCSVCDVGHYLNNKQCLQCPNYESCDFCDPLNPDVCLVCKSGYFMNDKNECLN